MCSLDTLYKKNPKSSFAMLDGFSMGNIVLPYKTLIGTYFATALLLFKE